MQGKKPAKSARHKGKISFNGKTFFHDLILRAENEKHTTNKNKHRFRGIDLCVSMKTKECNSTKHDQMPLWGQLNAKNSTSAPLVKNGVNMLQSI